MICPFLKVDCIENECEIYNDQNNRCSITLLADIACSSTTGYKLQSEELEPTAVKVVKNDG